MEAGEVMDSEYLDRFLAAMDAFCDIMNAETGDGTMFELELGDVEEPCLN